MKTNESAENYLETILMLKKEKGAVRSIDIVHQMEFTKPSVSRAMALLREKGQITMDKEGWIELTDDGREIAERIYERHLSRQTSPQRMPAALSTTSARRPSAS